MQRLYSKMLEKHFSKYAQMAFLCGPRQVGKTTAAKACKGFSSYYKYLSWDDIEDRERILSGYEAVCEGLPIGTPMERRPVLVLDELHKYKDWKSWLKGFIDRFKGQLNILVTGSARLDIYRKGGDSLLGRYFLYRAHPLSVGELLSAELLDELFRAPTPVSDEDWSRLFEFGGFPEPFVYHDKAFSVQWQRLRQQQVFHEDIRELAQVHEIAQLEVFGRVLQQQASRQVVYANIGKLVRVTDNTIRRWFNLLESFYYCFTIKPWSNNVTRSLIKEPRVFLWDWALVENMGQRVENFVACHLLKAVHYWTDEGFGDFKLWFLRDKDKDEVDFLVSKNGNPWLMVEVKTSYKEPLSESLSLFQKQISAAHVLQVAWDMPYEAIDCFALKQPTIVPLRTFLSQLV